jgi:hypothetical protein
MKVRQAVAGENVMSKFIYFNTYFPVVAIAANAVHVGKINGRKLYGVTFA